MLCLPLLLAALLAAERCARHRQIVPMSPLPKSWRIGEIADAYITLTLEAGTHEAEYVDAYYGPPDVAGGGKSKSAQSGCSDLTRRGR